MSACIHTYIHVHAPMATHTHAHTHTHNYVAETSRLDTVLSTPVLASFTAHAHLHIK